MYYLFPCFSLFNQLLENYDLDYGILHSLK